MNTGNVNFVTVLQSCRLHKWTDYKIMHIEWSLFLNKLYGLPLFGLQALKLFEKDISHLVIGDQRKNCVSESDASD